MAKKKKKNKEIELNSESTGENSFRIPNYLE